MKKLIPIMIAATMIVVVFAAADTGSEASENYIGIHINGESVNNWKEVDKENEHWKYDSHGLTITGDTIFDNYVTVKDQFGSYYSYCIYFNSLNLILEADLTIIAPDYNPEVSSEWAVYSIHDITITGSGKLTIKANGEDVVHHGLNAGYNISIDGPTVEICATNEIIADYWDISSFNMNSGELNLTGGGQLRASSIIIRGGTINVLTGDGCLTAYNDQGEARIEMTGGKIYFANVTEGNFILFTVSMKSRVIDLHDASGDNWVADDHSVKAVSNGPVTIEVRQNFNFMGINIRHDDMPVVVSIVTVTTIIIIGSIVALYLRRH